MKRKRQQYLYYSTCTACGHTLVVRAYSNGFTLFLQPLQKVRQSVDLLEVSNFRNPSGSETKNGYKRERSKNISDKGAKRTKSTKRSIISSIFSSEVTKF